MKHKLTNKLAALPKSPGVYFHKNIYGEIIYVGKAANLKNRVKQYFQASRLRDPKTDSLINEIADVDWMVVNSEAEALFLEAELIKRYLPKYNILLRDDKANAYIRINLSDNAPSVTITRRPLDDGASYWGPFLHAGAVNKALRYLRKAFPYSTHQTLPSRACLQYDLGLCPGPETDSYNRQAYIGNLKKLILFIEGKSQKVIRALENDMKLAASLHNYELAAILRNQLSAIKNLQNQIIFGDSELLDLSKDHALADLTSLLGLNTIPKRIEGYDISHWQGTDSVASMVVFINGTPAKSDYRKFKMRLIGNDDYAHISEVLFRRLQPANIKKWGKPDFMIIDGGKGQLTAAAGVLEKLEFNIPVIGLAKRYEEVIVHNQQSHVNINTKKLSQLNGYLAEDKGAFVVINLPVNSHFIKLLQRVRDEAHRFAVSYQSSIKIKRQSTSLIDDVPGIGSTTKRKLLKHFGSLKAVSEANPKELEKIVDRHRSELLKKYLPKTPNI